MTLKSKRKIKILIIFLFIIGLVIFIDKVAMFWYVGKEEVIVKNYIGMDFEKAKDTIQKLNLIPINGGSRYDKRFSKGKIIMQRPDPFSVVKSGRRVYLIVSEGEETIEMPNLRGMTLREARLKLTKLGIEIGEVLEDTSEFIQKDLIISQSIPIGIKTPKGISVNIVISTGSALVDVIVPNLISKSLSEAEKILKIYKLNIGKRNFQSSMDKLPNTILDQFPRSGEKVKEGSLIDLFISNEKVNQGEF